MVQQSSLQWYDACHVHFLTHHSFLLAVACPPLTVANSDTANVTANTTANHTVSCSNGYISSAGVAFNASCDGVGPGLSEWHSLTCEGMFVSLSNFCCSFLFLLCHIELEN